MKAQELRQKTIEELKELMREKKEKASQLEFGLASAKVKNVKERSAIRKDIARIITIMEEKEKTK